MKTKISFLCICIIQLCLAATQNIMAQQPQAKPGDHTLAQIHYGQPSTGYTYNVFQAPNKMFGYDIYQNGKGVFHQPAAMVPPNNVVANQQPVQPKNLPVASDQHAVPTGFSQKEFAERAALLSIEKIKKKSGPTLTGEEIKQLSTNKISIPLKKIKS